MDGVLGGYGSVSAADVASSKEFLQEVFGGEMRRAAANQQKLVAVGECGSSVVVSCFCYELPVDYYVVLCSTDS